MDPWFAKIAVFVNLIGYVIIRWPHGNRSGIVPVIDDRKGGLEVALLILAVVTTTILPIIWLTSGLLAFAAYPLHPLPYGLGVILIVMGLWLFYRSHADLGTNWSITLQMRENHQLVTSGVYAKIRHPMYSAMFLLGVAQALVLPNWIAGPAYLLGFGLLYALRVNAEEQMMVDRFGSEYETHRQRSGRLIPPSGQRDSQ